MSRTIRIIPALAGMTLAALAGVAIGWTLPRGGAPSQRIAARDYVVAHPELINEAIDQLRIGSQRAAIERPFAGACASMGPRPSPQLPPDAWRQHRLRTYPCWH